MELFHLALEAGQGIEFFGTGMNGPDTVDGVPFPRGHEGHSGFTIDDAPQAGRSGISPLVDTVLGFEPDIILLKIGTNDLDQNVDVANAPSRLGALLDDIFSKDDDVLVVVAQIVPSRSVELNARVAAYNAAIPNLVAERAASGQNVLVADMESAFLADPDYQNTLLADGLHPNERGYALLAATWYEVIGTFLR
jgi:lysophospholipase L1-like esterase